MSALIELVAFHNAQLAESGLYAKSRKREFSRKTFRELLNIDAKGRPEDGGTKHRNFQFGNRKRAYGDYLFHSDRDMFEVDYRDWLSGKLKP